MLSGKLFASLAAGVVLSPASMAQFAQEASALAAESPGVSDFLGSSVAVSEYGALAGAPRRDGGGEELEQCGAVFLFDPGTGVQIEEFYAPHAARYDRFGHSVAVHENLALIGAPYEDEVALETGCAYLLDLATGVFLRKIVPEIGGYEKRFGEAVAINEDYIVIGAPGDSGQDFASGSVYIFDTATGEFLRKIKRPSPQVDGNFGHRIAIDGNHLVVSDLPEKNVGSRNGKAYLFDAASGGLVREFGQGLTDLGDWFGSSVDVDGDLVAVGAPYLKLDGLSPGGVFLFRLSTGEALATLRDGLPWNDSRFGGSLAIDGDRLAVGSPNLFRNQSNSGAVSLFDLSDPADPEFVSLFIMSERANSALLGHSLAMQDEMLVAGAPTFESPPGGRGVYQSGAAFLFNTDPYMQSDAIAPYDGAQLDLFGSTMASNDTLLLIGSPRDGHSVPVAGSVYVHSATTGEFLEKLVAPDPGSGDGLGGALSVSQELILIGARGDDDLGASAGAVHMFAAESLAYLGKLLADDGIGGDFFGASVAQRNGLIVVGAPGENTGQPDSGAVYIFDAVTMERLHKLVPTNPQEDMGFGSAIDVSADYVVVGAKDYGTLSSFGAAYVFDAITGEQLHSLELQEITGNHAFGACVRIAGDSVIVGSAGRGTAACFDLTTGEQIATYEFEDSVYQMLSASSIEVEGSTVLIGGETSNGFVSEAGAVFTFDLESGQFLELVSSRSTVPDDRFGTSIAFANGSLWIGAPLDDQAASNSGRVYRFDRASPTACPADVDDSGSVNLADLNLVLASFGQTTPEGDTNGDGEVDLADLNAVLAAFGTSCE